jgi:hypothetical protein
MDSNVLIIVLEIAFAALTVGFMLYMILKDRKDKNNKKEK